MITLKLIKMKAFDTNGTKGVAYTCALKGRALNVSSLSFADEAKDTLVVDEKAMTLTINTKIEIVANSYYDVATESTKVGLTVMPALGVDVAKF